MIRESIQAVPAVKSGAVKLSPKARLSVANVTEPTESEPPIDPGEFPIDALNPALRRIAEESAAVHQTAIQLPAMSAIAVLAGALGKGWRVCGAVNGKTSFGNLFVICAAPKSYGKGATSQLASPMIAASKKRAEEFANVEKPRLQAEQMELKKRIEVLANELAGTKKKNEAGLTEIGKEKLRQELAGLIKREEAIEPLWRLAPAYWIGNTTTAAFIEYLGRNGHTLFSFSPEAGELVRIALGKFNKDDKADFDLLLSGYSVEPWRDTRIGRGDK